MRFNTCESVQGLLDVVTAEDAVHCHLGCETKGEIKEKFTNGVLCPGGAGGGKVKIQLAAAGEHGDALVLRR